MLPYIELLFISDSTVFGALVVYRGKNSTFSVHASLSSPSSLGEDWSRVAER